MKKVFLSHSTTDKGYVRVVASHLGRANVVFDEVSFAPGVDFRDSIRSGLESTKLFVFFASKASLTSVWCKYELDKAELLTLQGTLESHLTIIIDETVSYEDLPNWMKSTKAVIQTRPAQATRDIQHVLLSSTTYEKKAFVGRTDLQQNFISVLSDIGEANKKCFIGTGLEGIGRRSYFTRVLLDNTGLQLGPFFPLDETRNLDDLYFGLLNETSDLGTRENFAREIATFSVLAIENKIKEICAKLHLLCKDNCIPCIVDEGGLLNNSGMYKDEYCELLEKFLSSPLDHYVSIIHRRVPKIRELPFTNAILMQKVPPLGDGECLLLLKQLAKKAGILISSNDLEELVGYIDGYPPSAYFVVSFAQQYTVDCLLADKAVLEDFKAKRFTRFITDTALTRLEELILRYLASEQLVPLAVIAVVLEHPLEDVARILRELQDRSLILAVDGLYGLSSPLKSAVFRSKGYLDSSFYVNAKEQLTATFWKTGLAPTIEIVDATLHAVANSGALDESLYEDLMRVSILHKIARESYHKKDFESALKYAERAARLDPRNSDIRSIVFRANVQLEHWEAAKRNLKTIFDNNDRSAYYLQGFLLRKQRKYSDAIKSFRSALDSGDHGFPVYRDLASCLYHSDQTKEASTIIQSVLARESENIFVLDLAVRIFIDLQMFEDAKAYLDKLDRFDLDRRFVCHRYAFFYAARELWDLALVEATKACETAYSPFEAFHKKIDILIELGQYSQARNELDELKLKFKTNKDAQLLLECKLLLRQGKWKEARIVAENITDKAHSIFLSTQASIFYLQSQDNSCSMQERAQATRSFQELQSRIVAANSNLDKILSEDVEEPINLP